MSEQDFVFLAWGFLLGVWTLALLLAWHWNRRPR